MRKIILVLVFISSLFGDFFGNDKLHLIFMSNHNKPIYNKIIQNTINSLKDKYDITYQVLKDYRSIEAVINNKDYYLDNDKLVTGLVADDRLFKEDGYYILFSFKKEHNKFYISGVKFKKTGVKGIAQKFELLKTLDFRNPKLAVKQMANMLYFFITSNMIPYKAQSRDSVAPIIIQKNNKLEVIAFKPQKVILFNTTVSEDDFELAQKLGLISGKNKAELAKNYCALLNMYLPNKNFVTDDEYSFEDYFIQDNFLDGYKVYKPYIPTENKDFRCMGNDYTLIKEPLEDYELNSLGILWKIESDNFNVAGAIKYNDKTFTTVLVSDTGEGSVWHNDKKVDTFKVSSLKDIENVEFYGDNIKVIGFNKEYTFYPNYTYKNSYNIKNHYIDGEYYFKIYAQYKIDINQHLLMLSSVYNLPFKVTTFEYVKYLIVGGENGNLRTLKGFEYKGLKGDIVKIVKIFYNGKKYFGVITKKGEFAVYQLDKHLPIKMFPLIGYGYNNISVTPDGKYILLVNGNQISYIILTKVILRKGE